MTKTNRFKDITTVFTICSFFMVHGNGFCGAYFLLKKYIIILVHIRVDERENLNIPFFFYWTSFCLGVQTEIFKELP